MTTNITATTTAPEPSQQASPATPTTPASHGDLFDYQNMQWELDTPPDPLDYPPTQLYHLYTTSGHLIIGHWHPTYQMAVDAHHQYQHIVGWAPLLNEVGTIQ